MIKILLVLSIATLFFGCVGSKKATNNTSSSTVSKPKMSSYQLNAERKKAMSFWQQQSPLQLLDWKMFHTSSDAPKSQMTLRNAGTDTVTLQEIQVIVNGKKYDLFNKDIATTDKTKNSLTISADGEGIVIQSGESINGLYLNQSAVNKWVCPQANSQYKLHIDFVYEDGGISNVEGGSGAAEIVGVCQQG